MKKRVFITGVGVVSPIGNDRHAFWQGLQQGACGVDVLKTVPLDGLEVLIGGEVKGLDPKLADVNDSVSSRKMDRSTLFAVVAAREAVADANLQPGDLGDNAAVVIGSGLAGLQTLQEQTEILLNKGPNRVSPFTIPLLMPNAAVANVSLAFGISGTSYNVASACSSAGHAMIDAVETLQRGEVEIVVTGGAESTLTRLAISAFANMRATTKKYNDDPKKASRPFDANRDGFVMSEGACILIFETEDSLKKRGVKAYAEVVGYGASMDCHHIVQPDVTAKGAVKAIDRAIRMAGWTPTGIAGKTYVNAHGTSTKFNDLMETVALKQVFGGDAKKLRISSTKSITGHLIGAAAGVETAACIMALKDGVLPPTINYETPDPECDLDYIPNEARKADVACALNNTFGFGGHNVCLAFARAADRTQAR
jgi:3-oxoacyl-[acyl-carrier-protein] synthase II